MRMSPGVLEFLKALGGMYPLTAAMLPIVVFGKSTHVLYADDGPGKATQSSLAELWVLVLEAARRYETLVSFIPSRR
jgi:hypothetical protein